MPAVTRWIDHARLVTDSLRARRARTDSQRERAEHRLADRLARMHGVPQKIGQMLAASSRFTPDGQRAFSQLRERKIRGHRRSLERRLRDAWQRNPSGILESVDDDAIDASFGQVHRATLRDGRVVALKLLHPSVKTDLQTDLSLLGWLAIPFGNLRKQFKLDDYKKAMAGLLLNEIDYASEAESQVKLAGIAVRHPNIRVPSVISELSTQDVLVSEWLDTQSWTEGLLLLDGIQRRELSDALLRFYLDGLLGEGLMQADWHPGNIRILPGGQAAIAIFDFGSVCRLSQAERRSLFELAEPSSDRETWHAFLTLGFNPDLLKPMRAKLPQVARLLLEPFIEKDGYDLSHWNLAERISSVLGDDRWNFRAAGPPTLLPLLRSMHGVLGCLGDLRSLINGRSIWQEAARGISPRPARPPLQEELEPTRSVARLCVRVLRKGELKAMVTLPIGALDRLDEVIEPDVMVRIQQRGIDTSGIAQLARRSGFPTGPLFDLREDDSLIQVEIVRS